MTEKGKLEWLDASGKEIPNGAEVSLLAKVVGRHGGGRVSIEAIPGQRIIMPGKMCDQSKATGKRALQEANALIGAREKELAACRKEKESLQEQLTGVRAEFDTYIKGGSGKAKGG